MEVNKNSHLYLQPLGSYIARAAFFGAVLQSFSKDLVPICSCAFELQSTVFVIYEPGDLTEQL